MDTHTYIWLAEGSKNIDQDLVALLEESENLYLSTVSIWEIAITKSLGKLVFNQTLDDIYQSLHNRNIKELNIRQNHLKTLENLPYIHRDPFDRLLISQAISEEMALVSKDSNFNKYDVDVIW